MHLLAIALIVIGIYCLVVSLYASLGWLIVHIIHRICNQHTTDIAFAVYLLIFNVITFGKLKKFFY